MNKIEYVRRELKLSREDLIEVLRTYVNNEYMCNFTDFAKKHVGVYTTRQLRDIEETIAHNKTIDEYIDKLEDIYCCIIFQSVTDSNVWIWCD